MANNSSVKTELQKNLLRRLDPSDWGSLKGDIEYDNPIETGATLCLGSTGNYEAINKLRRVGVGDRVLGAVTSSALEVSLPPETKKTFKAYNRLGLTAYRSLSSSGRVLEVNDRVYYVHKPINHRKALFVAEGQLGEDALAVHEHDRRGLFVQIAATAMQTVHGFDKAKYEALESVGAHALIFARDMLSLLDRTQLKPL